MTHYMERVSIIHGIKPIIYVAPHGAACDDINTALITELLAEKTKGWAIINRGWERGDKIDYTKEKANCNNTYHCHEDVVKEEFLDPLIRFKNKILKKWSRVCIIYIHGMSNNIQISSGIDDLQYVIGWGSGNPPSYTCQRWVKDFIIYSLAMADNCSTAEGKSGGDYAAWGKKNMSQLFRKWYPDTEVDSVQIEIINKIRNNNIQAEATAEVMSIIMEDMLEQTAKWSIPSNFKVLKV
jgi:hypothetical protein